MSEIVVVQNQDRFKWSGIPFHQRYSDSTQADKNLLKAIHKIDNKLDLKFYLPKEEWHLVRYPHGRSSEKFVKVWACIDAPELGLRKEPGLWMIEALQAGDLQGAAQNRVGEIDAHNESIEKAIVKEQEDMTTDMAKEMRKPLKSILDGESHYQGVY